jgi:hypothetical protein
MQNIITERLILKGANLALTRDATMSTLFHDSFCHPALRAPAQEQRRNVTKFECSCKYGD